jgi:diguanylate cyclase (GGDEF)-like protein/PAS domain S-box-containing protein
MRQEDEAEVTRATKAIMTKIETEVAIENDSAVYKTLLESTKAIPWKIDWASAQFTYIGPQIESLLGWSQSSWLGVNDWAERMHPDDRDYVVNFCVSQSKAGVDHEADYRALTKDGGYVWIRDVVHVVRNAQGEVESLIGFMFDISERKENDDELARLYKSLEDLSLKDCLTGVANRRQFNLTLDREWAREQRSHQPLSLIMLDIDFFKQYNDHYGHVQGDECLKRVGRALSSIPIRASDLIARYGGEEFAILLPDTDAASARVVAEKCHNLMLAQQIPHAKSTISPLVTASLGVGTCAPTMDGSSVAFVDSVDKLLYQAKQKGRNRIECAT